MMGPRRQVGTPYLRDKADKAFTVLSGGQAAQLGLLSAEDGVRPPSPGPPLIHSLYYI